MKKKTIATSLLAILVSTYAVPFVSNAEGTQKTTQTTEVVAEQPTTEETTESSTPTETTESSTPTTESSTTSTDNSGSTDAKVYKDIESKRLVALDKIDAKIKAGEITESYAAPYKSRVLVATTGAEVDAVVQELINAIAGKSLVVLKEQLKADILSNVDGKVITEALVSSELSELASATTDKEANAAYTKAIKKINDAKAANTALIAEKTKAKNELLNRFTEGVEGMTAGDYLTYVGRVNAASTTDAVKAIMTEFYKVFGITPSDSSTTPSTSVPGDSSTEAPVKEKTLSEVKADARAELLNLYSKGLLTTNEYLTFLGEVDAAQTKDAVAGVIAKAKALIESRQSAVVVNTNVTTKVEKVTATTGAVKAANNAKQLPQTGEATANNLTALGLMSVALGSLAAAFKRKKS